MNWVLTLTMLGLLTFGVFCIYSATEFRDEPGIAALWRSQITWILVGLVLYFGAALVDYRWMRWGAIPLYIAALVVLVSVHFVGSEINASKSWISLGGFRFQPSQPMVVAGVVAIAFVLAELHKHVPVFRFHSLRLAGAGALAGIPAVSILLEGDLGSAYVWGPLIGAMLLVGSIPFRYLIVIALVGLTVLPLAYNFGLKEYQKARIEVWLDVLQGKPIDVQNEGWASDKILKAVGSSGWSGKGYLGKNTTGQKTMNRMGFLPQRTAHNDYIFAVLAEEHGFRGAMLLLSAFGFLILQLMYVAVWARDQLGRLVVVGTAAVLFAHIFQHVGMNIALTPITGIPLPFISYGGTFTISIMLLLGLVQSAWVHRNTPAPETEKKQRL
ncbi:MAG: FtsW/RodA/SpoVE family cell cycle protein [Verrucomicrobiales bacterium]|nr:FtsW/RodA/SpoVE family cell cycle protein [Verrucomicrobiales bacterium]